MRLDQGRPEIRSKLYSNQLLIDIFDPNSAVQSIVATISIRFWVRIQIQISNLSPNSNPNFDFISKIVEFDRK